MTGSIQPLVEFLYVPVFFAVLALALRSGTSLAVLFAFLALLYRLQTPLKRLDHLRVELSTRAAAFESFDRLLAEAAARPARSGRALAGRFADCVELQDVDFSFEGAEAPVLSGVSLTIRRGTVVALVGRSGSGKSTLVNLICGLYQPTAGRILVDGVALADLDVRSWRRRIAFAGQDADLLEGTIRDNVAFGSPEATEMQVHEALRLAHASEFVAALPNGIDTEVGPRGASLSGGQRQRIALARAFVRAPDLLILDEATNALDGMTEAAIQDAIDTLARRSTILLIAHRLETFRKADDVIVLEAGRVAERGPPQRLLAADGLLARQHALE
jgi:subfamily B ATP-binding cassette protein MsbA